MLAPNRIRFAGVSSNELNMPDLIMDCAFDSDNSEVSTFLTREAVASETYDGRNRRVSAFKYTENFSPKFTFLKKGFGDFTQDEVRALLKYLTSRDTTGLLEVYDDDSNVISWASIGNFSEIQLYKIANKRTVGVTAVWDSISPFCLSDLYTITKNTATKIETPMYYWKVSGDDMPEYLLTDVVEPKIGTVVYEPAGTISNKIIDVKMTVYGAISKIEDDGSYTVDNVKFKLTSPEEKTKITYDNKIIIDIDTDDPQKPVLPKIIIKHKNSTVVPVTPETKYVATDDMVENTVYHNGTTYYWKTAPSTDEAYFNAKTSNPELSTTSVRLTNKHTNFVNQTNVLGSVIVKNNNSTEEITLDGANKIISSDSERRIFGNDFNLQWLELYDGRNEITVEGNCEITLFWREPRKVGEY